MPGSNITISQYASSSHSNILPAIVDLHVACIKHDNPLIRFHPPFDAYKRAQMATFWNARLAAAQEGASTILLAFAGESRTLCGMCQLVTPRADTGPFRATVEMVMVSPSYQRSGIASQLMCELEEVARRKHRTFLRLTTTKGTPADLYLYPKMGYVKIGEVPGYGIQPVTGKLVDGVEYYKHLSLPGDAQVMATINDARIDQTVDKMART